MLDDYIDSAPEGSNEAVAKPRYHGSSTGCPYYDRKTKTACAGGSCVKDLFKREITDGDAEYVGHNYDMGGDQSKYRHTMFEYNPDIIQDEEGYRDGARWQKIPDRRVAYTSGKYPWLVAAYRFHNKVNMHGDWDLVKLDLPARAFTPEQVAAKGQHYIVHFSSRSPTDNTYTDAIDINALLEDVDPPELIYGSTTGEWGWSKTDHCQFVNRRGVVSPIRDATDNVSSCKYDLTETKLKDEAGSLGINVVPAANPDVVPDAVTRDVEEVEPVCIAGCTPDPADSTKSTAGYCRLATADPNTAVCAAPTRVHTVSWLNPVLTGVEFGIQTVAGARAGEYIEFEWDDVVHDVWQVPYDLADPCDTASAGFIKRAQLIISPSHHATIDAVTEDTFVDGRNRFHIPDNANGTTLMFVCTVNGHCSHDDEGKGGMQLVVNVGSTPAIPDPELTEGICEGAGYTLCPDQSKQTDTVATVKTSVNVPFHDMIGADSLQLSGSPTVATTPWGDFKYRKVVGKRCQQRRQNTAEHKRPSYGGIDHSNAAVWEFPDMSLRDVVEACSTSHPEACTGFSWKGRLEGDGFGVNHTIKTPYTPESARTYSKEDRDDSLLDDSPGWVSGHERGHWMELDLGEDRDLAGVVTQARGNGCCGPQAVTEFKILYRTEAGSEAGEDFKEVGGGGPLLGPDVEYLTGDWGNGGDDRDVRFNAYFPEVIKARYVRFVTVACYGMCTMRGEVLLHISNDMFTGKHLFRRCLETDQYTRVVNVGSLTVEEAQQYSYTVPKHFAKSVECPGCYECREVPLTPNYNGNPQYTAYADDAHTGFNIKLSNRGKATAVLMVSLPEPVYRKEGGGGFRLTWGEHNPEFICRIDPGPDGPGPAEPDLIDDAAWTTFLPPLPEGKANTDPNNADDVIHAIADGFHPAEAVRDWQSPNQANLAAVYPRGGTVNPAVTEGPWYSRDWANMSHASATFTLPATALDGARGGYWPPKPTVKVSFMPTPRKGEHYHRYYPREHDTYDAVTLLRERTTADGWHIDSGEAGASGHTHAVTGETLQYGWRCQASVGWFDANWNEKNNLEVPPYTHGAAKQVSTYLQPSTGAQHARCPDGRLNAWEVAVPNGVYTVTAGLLSDPGFLDRDGCTFENVRAAGSSKNTYIYSVEVADGRFTLSAAPPLLCQAVSWLKLDMVSDKMYPDPWLPAPPKAWWQLELDDPTADVGMVEVRLPHQEYTLASTYPHRQESAFPDCRQWWLYAPAKCYRMFMNGRKRGVHPDAVSYPNFPGFAEPFLNWYFDLHDTDGNGELQYEEFRAAQAEQSQTGTYAMWSGFHSDNAGHLWHKLDVIHRDHDNEEVSNLERHDGTLTKDEWVHGMLSQPLNTFCDLFESTESTHGGNYNLGWCSRMMSGTIPEHFGHFNDDGEHGFVVSVSDTPCTDQDGCPNRADDSTLCEHRNHHTDYRSPAAVDCKGAKGKYVQISLPGDGKRILPTLFVTAHRASIPPLPSTHAANRTAATNPKLQTVCYGVRPNPPPAADAPDLLSAAKIHPKTIVADNPEDPIWWSTCYDRVVVREWLPLLGEDEDGDGEKGAQYAFNNGSYCLDCESVRQNHANGGYDMSAMPTPHWWLQKKGECANCDAVVFGIHTSTSTSTVTSAATTSVVTTNDAEPQSQTTPAAKCATVYCGVTEADVEANVQAAFRAALIAAAAGIDGSTADAIWRELQQNVPHFASLVTAASTKGLAALLADQGVVAVLENMAELEEATVADVAAAATAAEAEAAAGDGSDDGAGAGIEAKSDGGAIAGGVVGAMITVGLLVAGVVLMKQGKLPRGRGSNAAADGRASVASITIQKNPAYVSI